MTEYLTQTMTQLAMLFTKIHPSIWTTLETSKARVESRMMLSIKGVLREFLARIYSFEGRIGVRLCEVYELNLLSICEKIVILRSEVISLSETYFPIVSSVIPTFIYLLSRLSPIVFNYLQRMIWTWLLGTRKFMRRTYKIR